MKNRIRDEHSIDLSRTLATAKESLSGMMTSQPAAQAVRTAEEYITRHPALSLGIAASVGMMLGWFIKRR